MKYSENSSKFRKFFELPSSPVAVRIITDASEQKTNKPPMRFCEMVRRSAMYGESFVFGVEELTCTSGELALSQITGNGICLQIKTFIPKAY